MTRILIEERIKKNQKFREEVLNLFKQACREVTDFEFEVLNQKLDRIMYKLDLLLEKQNHDRENPLSDKIFPKKAEA